jgi:DNA repair exonuclease SbcCD ATPase subunit
MQNAAHHADEVATRRLASDAMRIAELEQELQSTQQKLAQREAALAHTEQQLQNSAPGSDAAHPPVGTEDQSTQLRAAQDKIAELLERLAQLEAAHHTLQENAAHELQQLRESFETRITKLRMELAAKEQAQPQQSPPANSQVEITALEEGFQKQIQELQGQLAEQRTLLENRNEELIKVKAERDALQDHVAQLDSGDAQESMDETRSVELREEDAVEPLHFVNGSVRPDPLDMRGTDAVGQDPGGVVASNRLAQLEGRVRSWHPQLEKESAFGSGRRWNIGVFKRRWKA